MWLSQPASQEVATDASPLPISLRKGGPRNTPAKLSTSAMDSIKKKMEKLANETAEADMRIAHFEEIKEGYEAEAEKFEEQVRNILKKMQAMESAFDVCTEDLFNQTVKLEEMEKKAGNAESEVSGLRSRLILLQENNEKQEDRWGRHTSPSPSSFSSSPS